MKIRIVSAIGKNRELGKNNDLCWKLKEDLQHFKTTTMGKPMIMGLNTYKSLPKVLPNRDHIVLVPQEYVDENIGMFEEENFLHGNVFYVTSIEEAVSFADFCVRLDNEKREKQNDEICVVGGAFVYKQFIDLASHMTLTLIDEEDVDADVFFPHIHEKWIPVKSWNLASTSPRATVVEYVNTNFVELETE